MQKIPTVFIRDPVRPQFVTREVTPGCEWVLAGDGVATRKYDGTNVRVTIQDGVCIRVEKRRNPTREQKAAGAEPGYVDASRDDPADKHIFAAVDAADFNSRRWVDGAWPCEAVGPKIQGGHEGFAAPGLIAFSLPYYVDAFGHMAPTSFDEMVTFLTVRPDWEGIVFRHPDGRMAKLKRRDLGLTWPPRRES